MADAPTIRSAMKKRYGAYLQRLDRFVPVFLGNSQRDKEYDGKQRERDCRCFPARQVEAPHVNRLGQKIAKRRPERAREDEGDPEQKHMAEPSCIVKEYDH